MFLCVSGVVIELGHSYLSMLQMSSLGRERMFESPTSTREINNIVFIKYEQLSL